MKQVDKSRSSLILIDKNRRQEFFEFPICFCISIRLNRLVANRWTKSQNLRKEKSRHKESHIKHIQVPFFSYSPFRFAFAFIFHFQWFLAQVHTDSHCRLPSFCMRLLRLLPFIYIYIYMFLIQNARAQAPHTLTLVLIVRIRLEIHQQIMVIQFGYPSSARAPSNEPNDVYFYYTLYTLILLLFFFKLFSILLFIFVYFFSFFLYSINVSFGFVNYRNDFYISLPKWFH